jgi:hypothetical protein
MLSTSSEDWFTDIGAIAASVFKLLSHTPVTTAGVNIIEHVACKQGTDVVDLIRSWLPSEQLLGVVGTNAKIGAVVRAQWDDFGVVVRLEQSVFLPEGVYINQNYEISEMRTTDQLSKRVFDRWDAIFERSRTVRDAIVEGPAR